MEVTQGDLEGKIIKYGDSDEERAFMIDDGEAYFWPFIRVYVG